MQKPTKEQKSEYIFNDIKKTVKLDYFPKCSPEENPTEQCWKPGRNILANRVIPSLNAAKYHLRKTFNDTKAMPKMFHYLRD